MRLLRKTLLFLIICLCTLIEPLFSQTTYQFKGSRKREQITFTKARGLIVMSTYINQQGPFNFVLDSGVGIMIITDPKLKDSLNLQYLRKIEITGLGEGKEIDAYTTPFLNVQIGSAVAKSTSAAVLDNDVFNLSSYAGMPIHGLIGYDFFASFLVRIYFDAGYFTLYSNRESRLLRKGLKIPIEIEQNKPYVNVLADQGEYKKMPLKLIIDTGAGHPLSLESYENKAFPLNDKFMQANLGVGLAGNINGFIGRVDRIKIGRFDIKDPIASFPIYEDVAAKSLSVPRNGSIGNQLLKRFEIIFDYGNSCIYLKPNINFKEPFEHDMSGMELTSSEEDFTRYFVNRVEPHSPADEFGIQKNDEIISINFKKVSTMSMNEIIEILKSRDGRNLYLEIGRGEELIAGVFTLRRRI